MESRIRLAHAKEQFERYISDYDCNNPKIRLKVAHTLRVMDSCRMLAESLHMNAEQTDLAVLIGLLHDIGRFEQLRLTNSFDDSILPHAECSLSVLFDQNRLRDFIETDVYDSVIYESIKNHGVFRIDESLSEDAMLYARLIRDADKLDNFHTKLTESIPTMLDVDMETLSKEEISDYAFDTFQKRLPLENSKRETHMDMWVSYIAYIFDLNFAASFAFVKEHEYIRRLAERIPYRNERTIRRMKQLQATAEAYVASPPNTVSMI